MVTPEDPPHKNCFQMSGENQAFYKRGQKSKPNWFQKGNMESALTPVRSLTGTSTQPYSQDCLISPNQECIRRNRALPSKRSRLITSLSFLIPYLRLHKAMILSCKVS